MPFRVCYLVKILHMGLQFYRLAVPSFAEGLSFCISKRACGYGYVSPQSNGFHTGLEKRTPLRFSSFASLFSDGLVKIGT